MSYNLIDGIIDLPIDNIESAFPTTANNEIDYLNLSIASNYLTGRITKETKNLIKKTSEQLKKTTTYKEGIKFLDELQCDVSRTKEMFQNENQQPQQNADAERNKLSKVGYNSKAVDVFDGNEENMRQPEIPLEVAPLSAASAFIADVVQTETRKIIKITGDQIKNNSKYQESVKYFDEFCNDFEQNIELRKLKSDVFEKAHFLLSHRGKQYRSKNMPNQFSECVIGLLKLKQNPDFYDSNVTTQEVLLLQELIRFSLEESIFFKAFDGSIHKRGILPLIGNESLDKSNPRLSLFGASASCRLPEHSSNTKLLPNLSSKIPIIATEDGKNQEGSLLQSAGGSNQIVFQLHAEANKNKTYNQTFLKFCSYFSNHLFEVEDLFSDLKFDYWTWHGLILLFIEGNQRSIIADESSRESLNSVTIFISSKVNTLVDV